MAQRNQLLERACTDLYPDAATNGPHKLVYGVSSDTRRRVVSCKAMHPRVPMHLLLIDIDKWRYMNDNCGYLPGEQALRPATPVARQSTKVPLDHARRPRPVCRP